MRERLRRDFSFKHRRVSSLYVDDEDFEILARLSVKSESLRLIFRRAKGKERAPVCCQRATNRRVYVFAARVRCKILIIEIRQLEGFNLFLFAPRDLHAELR